MAVGMVIGVAITPSGVDLERFYDQAELKKNSSALALIFTA